MVRPVCGIHCFLLSVSAESCRAPLLSGLLFPPPIPLSLDLEGMGSRISVLGSVLVYLSNHLPEAFVPGQNTA